MSYSFEQFSDDKDFDFEKHKQEFIDNMDMLKTMSVQEQTLYKKWQEFNKSEKLRSKADKLDKVQQQMWTPTDIYDKEKTIQEIQDLEPIVEYTDDNETWTLLRQGISSMEFVANPGRNIKFFVKDKITNKYLGVICMGSDVVSIKVRDEFLGWTKENKLDDAKLQHTAIGTSIIATQPLGYNFLGGKLVSALVTCSTIRNKWKENYNQTLAGITTTALYGIHSQYNGIPHWKTLGETAGQINLKPDDSIYLVWNQWLKENHPEEHHKAVNATGPKNNVINRIFKHLGMKAKDYQHGFKRGVYFADIYENGKEFFRSNIEEKDLVMKEKYQLDYDRIISWWKPKAIRRYEKLHSENRLKSEQLFYSDIMDMSWEETKEKYLGEVGR
mgnify:FL=1|jgi:hypothetical protein|tara:strand:+ start:218 stop:1375 length:1158 start_codon:yes stop_codon:yes gene_type:complete